MSGSALEIPANALNRLVYMATASKTVGNTSAETTGLGTGTGLYASGATVTIPANVLKAGMNVVGTGGGVYTTPAISVGNVTVRMKVGGTTVASAVISALVGGITNGAFQFDSVIAVQAAGSSGSAVAVGTVNFATAAGGRLFFDLTNGGSPVTVDTTVSNVVDVTVQWATASTDRTATVSASSIALQV